MNIMNNMKKATIIVFIIIILGCIPFYHQKDNYEVIQNGQIGQDVSSTYALLWQHHNQFEGVHNDAVRGWDYSITIHNRITILWCIPILDKSEIKMFSSSEQNELVPYVRPEVEVLSSIGPGEL